MTEILNTVGSGSGYPILAAFAMFIAAWSLGRAIIKLLKLRADHLCAFVLGIDVIALLLLAMLSLFPGGRILAVTRGILAVLTIAALCYTKSPHSARNGIATPGSCPECFSFSWAPFSRHRHRRGMNVSISWLCRCDGHDSAHYPS